jgi:hypothetical protein
MAQIAPKALVRRLIERGADPADPADPGQHVAPGQRAEDQGRIRPGDEPRALVPARSARSRHDRDLLRD